VIGAGAVALARRRVWLYLIMASRRTAAAPSRRVMFTGSSRMAQPISTPQQMPDGLPSARRAVPAVAVGAAGLGVVLMLGALVLWFHYGTAVFFEMIASGLSACF
jgi:hypothetical protein